MIRPPDRPLQIVDPEPDWYLLDRHFSGETSAAESELVARWASADASNAQLLESLRRLWSEAALLPPVTDDDAAWRALRARIAASPRRIAVRAARKLEPSELFRPRRPLVRWMGIAAAAALVVASGSVIWRQQHATTAGSSVEPAREYATTRGQRSELTLVDGTRIWLSVDSRLRVGEGYGAGARDVWLDGEAYFVVRHDAKRPFRVHTRGAVSEDLGTEFGVRAYAGDAAPAVVVVASGRVALRGTDAGTGTSPGGAVELGRGQMGVLDRAGRITVTDGVNVADALGWREGRLDFAERPLAEVIPQLERWYDLEIAIDDSSLASVPVTASFDGQTVDQALAMLAETLDAGYTRAGRLVRFTANVRRR